MTRYVEFHSYPNTRITYTSEPTLRGTRWDPFAEERKEMFGKPVTGHYGCGKCSWRGSNFKELTEHELAHDTLPVRVRIARLGRAHRRRERAKGRCAQCGRSAALHEPIIRGSTAFPLFPGDPHVYTPSGTPSPWLYAYSIRVLRGVHPS